MKNWVLGNWKMNQNLSEVDSFLESLKDFNISENIGAGIAPQNIHLQQCSHKKIKNLKIGSQNCYFEEKGAFTGESSAPFLKEAGADFILIGHSERRAIFKENHELLAKKVKHVLDNDLMAVFCIGETLDQRESDKTFSIINEQLVGLKDISGKFEKLIIAYEPVWAIGTGKTASPEQAGEVHSYIRNWLIEHFTKHGKQIPIVYGGSVKPENFAELLAQQEVSGGLVGGASLKAESFKKLCEIAIKV